MSLSILVSSVCMPSSGLAGSQGSSTSSFLRNLHTVLHSGCTMIVAIIPQCIHVSKLPTVHFIWIQLLLVSSASAVCVCVCV